MRAPKPILSWLAPGGLALVLSGLAFAAESAADPLARLRPDPPGEELHRPKREPDGDPVVLLQQALQASGNPLTPEQADRDKARLEKAADAVRRIRDLRRALLLGEWRGGPVLPGGMDWKREVWEKMAGRLEKALRKALDEDEPGVRLAAVILLGDMREAERSRELEAVELGPNRFRQAPAMRSFPPRLAPALRELLARDKEPAVRAAGAHTLAEIAPEAPETAQALTTLLADRDLAGRRAAADGLDRAIRLHTNQGRLQFVQPEELAVPEKDPRLAFFQAAGVLAGAAGTGLRVNDTEVRRRCLGALQRAAETLWANFSFPSEDSLPNLSRVRIEDLSPEQKQLLAQFEADLRARQPLARALTEHLPAVICLAGDGETAVCIAACQTLEGVATARENLRKAASRVPALAKDDPLEGVAKAAAELGPTLSHKEVRARLAALYVLETLGDDAVPAIDGLIQAAADENPFVRWGAARALGQIAPREAEKAVPALARLAADPNAKVRLTALKDLERYGAKAAGAVKEMREMADRGDAATRVAAIRALRAVGPEARPAVPVLLRALGAAAEAPVRAAAARALAGLGGGEAAAKALRKALDDADREVREAAGDALLGER
jgi:HEAT repeat protein